MPRRRGAYDWSGMKGRLGMQLDHGQFSQICLRSNQREILTVHPTKAFAGNHLEVDALVSVLSVYHV